MNSLKSCAIASFASLIPLDDVIPTRTRYATDVLLLVSAELFLFRDDPEIPNRELLELATGAKESIPEGGRNILVGAAQTGDEVIFERSNAPFGSVAAVDVR
jgi:hypothetical protein